MPIPPQNDFLQPFLSILSDGQAYTRAQMLFKLTRHFDISQDEAPDDEAAASSRWSAGSLGATYIL